MSYTNNAVAFPFCELSAVGVNVRGLRSPSCDPEFTSFDLAPADARKLAAELLAAADDVEAFDRSVEEFFRNNPQLPGWDGSDFP